MKKKIFIVSAFSGNLDGDFSNRFVYLSNLLGNEYDVKLITTNFFHSKKEKIVKPYKYENFDIVSINVPTYKSNISLKRLWSHLVFACKVWFYLRRNTNNESIVYCSFPPIFVALFSFFAIKNKKRFILDVQDLWPEVFYASSEGKVKKKLFIFHRVVVRFLSKNLHNLVAVSQTYLNHFVHNGFNGRNSLVVFIGTHYKNNKLSSKSSNNESVTFVYAGTIGHSYNLSHFVKRFSIAQNSSKLNKKIELVIIGSGPRESEVKDIASKLNANVKFTGRVSHDEVMKYLSMADVAVNSVGPNMQQSIINKHGDYVISGLPILSTQDNTEFMKLVNENKIGINVHPRSEEELEDSIIRLANDDTERLFFSQNSKKVAANYFNRDITYLKIKEFVDLVSKI